jgi:meiotically up-regulated gene 157 (Mug157) protein
MRFAFSAHNPGFVAGALSGLGSAHTPGIWPLGDAQEWAVAVVQDDRSRADAVVARLRQVVSADGMLPETYDADSGDWLARHWFAWPGSLVGLLHATIDGRGPWVAARASRGPTGPR